jgi:type I restriction enzyme S subunit
MSSSTTPPLRGTPPAEGNNSPSPKGCQAKPDGVVPKLRFPEFREAGEWEAKLLGAVCEMQAGKFVAATEISERQAEGLYPCFGGNGLRGYTKTFNQSGRYSLIGRQGALCGNVNLAEGNFYATEHAVVTTPKPGNSTDWLFYNLCLLNLNRFATGQAQPGLSIDVLEKVSCATPKDEKEQQKIANCLASLDERITLEAQKLDTLKTHKKGLMQQLFPAEGETLPKLRFPEFRDAGEWEERELGPLTTKVGSGITPTGGDKNYKKKGRPFVRSQNVGWGELIGGVRIFV